MGKSTRQNNTRKIKREQAKEAMRKIKKVDKNVMFEQDNRGILREKRVVTPLTMVGGVPLTELVDIITKEPIRQQSRNPEEASTSQDKGKNEAETNKASDADEVEAKSNKASEMECEANEAKANKAEANESDANETEANENSEMECDQSEDESDDGGESVISESAFRILDDEESVSSS